MIVVMQRVSRAAVRVDGATVASIGPGLCLLACAVGGDSDREARALARKLVGLRVFADARGATNLALADVGGALLVVPQFTLAAEWRQGRRPSFARAAPADAARARLAAFVGELAAAGARPQQAPFGAEMELELVNSGPFTLVLDSRQEGGAGAAGSRA